MPKVISDKKYSRFRILLDSAFAAPKTFTRLNKKCNLAHVVDTYHKSPQLEDEYIYQLAFEEKRLILTINYKDF